jgi:hypothetical protein
MIVTVSAVLLSVTAFPPCVELKSLAPRCRDYAASATGSIKLGSLFLTLPTRVLTGQQIISSEGVGSEEGLQTCWVG